MIPCRSVYVGMCIRGVHRFRSINVSVLASIDTLILSVHVENSLDKHHTSPAQSECGGVRMKGEQSCGTHGTV